MGTWKPAKKTARINSIVATVAFLKKDAGALIVGLVIHVNNVTRMGISGFISFIKSRW